MSQELQAVAVEARVMEADVISGDDMVASITDSNALVAAVEEA